jgi:hypothetical protein
MFIHDTGGMRVFFFSMPLRAKSARFPYFCHGPRQWLRNPFPKRPYDGY